MEDPRHEPEGADSPEGPYGGVGTVRPPARPARPAARPGEAGDLAGWLAGVEFPATPYDLMRHAERMGAPHRTCLLLRALPTRRYLSLSEVCRAAGSGTESRGW